MKKREVTIQFIFDAVEDGVNLAGTAKKKVGKVCTGTIKQTYSTTMPHRSFTLDQYNGIDYVYALEENQRDQIYQEMIDEVDGRATIDSMFTFDLHRGQHGHIYLIQDRRGHEDATTAETIDRNNRVVAQLVRFGYIDKLKSARSIF
mgnify:CR=1 FL=1